MHKTWIYRVEERCGAKCKCGKRSGLLTHQWQAEDWAREHIEEVNRIQARNANRSPSLAVTLKQYREAEVNPDCTPEQQALWKVLGDEIERRINTSNDEQMPLW